MALTYLKTLLITLLFLLVVLCCQAQRGKNRFRERVIQLSLVPGVSTNGLHSAWFMNKFSINIFSGISAVNRYFEISGISSLNTNYATGIQVSGLANVIGSNTFINLTVGEERAQLREGMESNMTGIQFAGLLNVVRDNLRGWQTTAGINFVHKGTVGWQLAGLSNMTGSYMIGVQMAGIYNVALKSSSGTQIALFSNLTNGEMQGLQLSILNKAVKIRGRNSSPPGKETGWQVGIVNIAKKMNGTQIGLVNKAKDMYGIQVGLINLFKKRPPKNTMSKSGIPIGLINIGSTGHHKRLYTTDIFLYNLEFTTGNCYNCSNTQYEMPIHDKYKIMNQNALIASYNPSLVVQKGKPKWGFGYGFERVKYNKVSMTPNPLNQRKFISYGVYFMHINFEDQIYDKLSLLTRASLEYGRILRNKVFTFYIFGGMSLNSYLFDANHNITPEKLSVSNQISDIMSYGIWPGYQVGIHIF